MLSPSPSDHPPVQRAPLRVVFLDRDGVINHDSPDYIKHWSEVSFIPGSLSAIKMLNRAGFTVIVVTNQSAVGRKMISMDKLAEIHHEIGRAARAQGGCITDVFFCPHLPEDGCTCRKPLPGLIHQARKKYAIDLEKSFMVGDSAKDIECARRAGCGHAVLVRTGNGRTAANTLAGMGIHPDKIAEDLADAAEWIVSRK